MTSPNNDIVAPKKQCSSIPDNQPSPAGNPLRCYQQTAQSASSPQAANGSGSGSSSCGKAGTLANRVTLSLLPPTALSVADDLNLLPLIPSPPRSSLHPPHCNHLTYTACFHPVTTHIAHHAWRPGWPLAGSTRDCVARASQQHPQ